MNEKIFIKETDIKKIVKWAKSTFDIFNKRDAQVDCLRNKRLNLIDRTNPQNGYQINCITTPYNSLLIEKFNNEMMSKITLFDCPTTKEIGEMLYILLLEANINIAKTIEEKLKALSLSIEE